MALLKLKNGLIWKEIKRSFWEEVQSLKETLCEVTKVKF